MLLEWLPTVKMNGVLANLEERDPVLTELISIIEQRNIRVVFQPIVSLTNGEIMGYEALSRGPAGSPLESPVNLFSAAESYNKVWELDFLCRTKALERAKEILDDKFLFINVDPKIIKDVRFQKGMTKDILDNYKVKASKVIFEITEKTSIEDYRNFRQILDNYLSQGYKIAIDDTGSGYSGLKMLAETRPQFVKIDMDLVRNIDKDSLKQSLIKAFYDFSMVTNMKIIAEGIETIDELNTLIDIGIPYGQGYLLHKPTFVVDDISVELKELIRERNEQKRRQTFHTTLTMPIGDIVRRDVCFPHNATGSQVLEFFNENPNIMGIVLVDDEIPVGLLMKDKFLSHLATQYGVAVYMNRPVSLLMDKNPLIVDADTPMEQVSKSAVCRDEERLYDYIIVTSNGKYMGITTVRHLLEKTTQLEINRAKHSNPLSGLPGNILIEEKLKQIIASDRPFAVLYLDLDNFKPYNDIYGFENGDNILCLTAQIIKNELDNIGIEDAFLGHIGGDDFIAVLPEIDIDCLCKAIIQSFDSRVKEFYTERDQVRGYIIAKNRHGVEEKYPIISISIAAVTSKGRKFTSPLEISEAAAEVKKKCKLNWQSCYMIV